MIISFFLSIIGMILPKEVYFDTISPWHIRNEFIFFGVLAAGIILQRIKNTSIVSKHLIVSILFSLQFSQVLAYSAFNVFFRYGNPQGAYTNFFKSPTRGDKLFDFFQINKNKYGNRILLSPDIEKDLKRDARGPIEEKFYSIPDINIYTGINVVNDMLKGISMDRIYSTRLYTGGEINSNYDLIKNSALLDIAGINWVLITKDEYDKHAEYIHLKPKAYFEFDWNDQIWILLPNDDTWPKAFMMTNDVFDTSPIYRNECGHTGLLCAELEPFLKNKMNVKVKKTGSNGHFDLLIPAQEKKIVIGLSTMYRPEWQAFANGKKLEVKPLFNAFIGVEVPPGTTNIKLDFNPKVRIRLTYLSMITFACCILGLIINSRNNRRFKVI